RRGLDVRGKPAPGDQFAGTHQRNGQVAAGSVAGDPGAGQGCARAGRRSLQVFERRWQYQWRGARGHLAARQRARRIGGAQRAARGPAGAADRPRTAKRHLRPQARQARARRTGIPMRSVFALALVLSVAGCGGGSTSTEPRTFDLGLAAPSAAFPAVRIASVRAVIPFESTDMQYRLAYRNAAEIAAFT